MAVRKLPSDNFCRGWILQILCSATFWVESKPSPCIWLSEDLQNPNGIGGSGLSWESSRDFSTNANGYQHHCRRNCPRLSWHTSWLWTMQKDCLWYDLCPLCQTQRLPPQEPKAPVSALLLMYDVFQAHRNYWPFSHPSSFLSMLARHPLANGWH